jgi:uncharacterized protein YjiS (DUF1127 family)
MAYFNNTRTITLADRFAAFRTELNTVLAKRKMYNTTVSELSALTNRELADLGINRSAIKGIATEAMQNI